MRITNHSATQSAIAAITDSRARLEAALQKVTSGKRVTIASDDPGAALGIMQDEAQLRAREQYRRNINGAQSRLTLETSVLDRMSAVLTRARELGVSQGSETATGTTRKATAAEVNQLIADVVQLAGTKLDNEYIFGGRNPDSPPFTLNSSGPAYSATPRVPAAVGSRAVEVATGQRMVATHDATEIFGDGATGSIAALQALATALASGDGNAVRSSLSALDAAMDATQALTAEAGARASQLQRIDDTHAMLALDLEANISTLRDVDLESVLTEMASRQTAYQAAMAATARVAGLTLTDYLR